MAEGPPGLGDADPRCFLLPFTPPRNGAGCPGVLRAVSPTVCKPAPPTVQAEWKEGARSLPPLGSLKRQRETGTHTAQGRVGRVGRRLCPPSSFKFLSGTPAAPS